MICFIVHDKDTNEEHSFESFDREDAGIAKVEAENKLVQLAHEGHAVYITREEIS